MITYQEFLKAFEADAESAVLQVVDDHRNSDAYSIALDADDYDHQRNVTIIEYKKTIKTLTGAEVIDPFAANYKLPCNLFRRLNTQRTQYSLGSGVTFEDEAIKDKLGFRFDSTLQKLGYAANIHGVAFGFWNFNKMQIFKLTEFAPLYDETNGVLMAGVRFWQLTDDYPLNMWLYTVSGTMRFTKASTEQEAKRLDEKFVPYVGIKIKSIADGENIVDGENYPSFPIVPLYGSELKQSSLVGMREGIDSYDLIRSGLANDLADTAYIYWLVTNAEGMDDIDKAKLLQELRQHHMGVVSGGSQTEGGESNKPTLAPYTQDVPHAARTAYLDRIKAGIYEDFGGLDVHVIAAGATNDHIDAAYQPLDENADDFEYQVIDFIQNLCALQGIAPEQCVPTFKRNRISNQLEQTQMVLAAASYLDEETVLKKLPFITVDEVEEIIKRKDDENVSRYQGDGQPTTDATGADQTQATDPTVTASDVQGAAEQAAGKTLNGAQTQSLITVVTQYAAGTLTIGQAVNIIAVAIGVSKEEAQALIEGAI